MENQVFWGNVRRKFGAIMLVGFLFAALSFAGLIVFSKNFRSNVEFLTIQNQKEFHDFYSLAKSSEYLGKVLSESIYGDRFIDEVIQTGKIESGFFPADKKERMDKWKKVIKVEQKNLEIGVIEVAVFDNDSRNAMKLSQAISQVLVDKNVLFRGGDASAAEVRVFSGPIVERNPDVMRMVFVSIAGFVLGVLFGLAWLLLKMPKMILSETETREYH